MEQLRNKAIGKLKEIYGEDVSDELLKIIDSELEQIMESDNLDLVRQTASLCIHNNYNNKYRIGFKGAQGSSLVLYLLGITQLNPLDLAKIFPLYSEILFKDFSLSLSIPKPMKKSITYNYGAVPERLNLYSTKALDIICKLDEEYIKRYGEKISINLKRFTEIELDSEIITVMKENGVNISLFQKVLTHNNINGKTLARAMGISYGSGTYLENVEQMLVSGEIRTSDIISSVEDVYEYLIRLETIPQKEALTWAFKIKSPKSQMRDEDYEYLRQIGCGEQFIKNIESIKYLFSRAQCVSYAVIYMILWKYKKINEKLYYSVFNEINMESDDIRGKNKMKSENKIYIPWYSPEYKNDDVILKNLDYQSLTPQDIKSELEKYIVGQSEACRKTAIMIYQHFQGHRSVNMIAGPTGSGKSYITETLKKLFPDVVYLREISNLTADGWKGSKKVSTLFNGIKLASGKNVGISPIIVLDECDKCFSPKSNSSYQNVSEDIQSELLATIQGTEINLSDEKHNENYILDTRKMSFIFAGAFANRANEIAKEESNNTIGFGAFFEKTNPYDRDITIADIQRAGCIPELCGRIGQVINLNKIDEDIYRKMMEDDSFGPIKELEQEFSIMLKISERKKDEIAHEVVASGYGVRSLKNIFRKYIDEAIWEDCNTKVIEIS